MESSRENEQFVFDYAIALNYAEIEEQLGRPLTEAEKETLGSEEFAKLLSENLPYKKIASYLAIMLAGEVKDPFANLTLNPPPGKYIATISFLVDGKPKEVYFATPAFFPILSFYDKNGNALSYLPFQAHWHLNTESQILDRKTD